MPKIDKLKPDISFHEKLFFGTMEGFFAIIAWVASYYENADWWLLQELAYLDWLNTDSYRT
jgi:hypothetical protein